MPPVPSGPPVDLESYYYGQIEGDIGVLMTEFKADMAFKCHLCKKVFMNNIEFMKHLSLHVENERATAVDLVDLCQCKYCLKDFENEVSLKGDLDKTTMSTFGYHQNINLAKDLRSQSSRDPILTKIFDFELRLDLHSAQRCD